MGTDDGGGVTAAPVETMVELPAPEWRLVQLPPDVDAALRAPLDPARIKSREGSGRQALSYLEGHDVRATLNRIFGFGAWGHEIREMVLLGSEEVTNRDKTKHGWHVAYRCTVTLRVQGCVAVDGEGFGDGQDYTGSKLACHELAVKEAETDALKRAAINFGDQFGLVLYEKDVADRKARIASDAGEPGPKRENGKPAEAQRQAASAEQETGEVATPEAIAAFWSLAETVLTPEQRTAAAVAFDEHAAQHGGETLRSFLDRFTARVAELRAGKRADGPPTEGGSE